jgi:colanic acid biosynthesis glycosyl transferase WcaI
MRILIVSQWFSPEPVMKGITFARELCRLGHEVEVITGFPNYPGGKVYAGYRIRPFEVEIIEGIRVIRVAMYPSHDASALKRLLTHGSFAVSALLIGGWIARKPDVIYTYDTPLTAGVISVLLGWLKRAPMIFDLQDLWPDTIGATSKLSNPRLLAFLQSVCHWVYARAKKVVVLSPGFAKTLEKRGIAKDHIRVIYNWCDETELNLKENADTAIEMQAEQHFNLVFAGSMGKGQGLETVIRAAKLVETKNPRVQFLLVGSGVELEHLKIVSRELNVNNLRFLLRRPMTQIGQVFYYADALLVHLKDEPLFAVTIPSKTQAYLSVGKPVIMAVRGDAAELIIDANAGITCEPENPQALADAVLHLAELPKNQLLQLGENGAKYYRNALSVRVGTQAFINVFQEAIKERA